MELFDFCCRLPLCQLCSHESNIFEHETRATDEVISYANNDESVNVAGVRNDVFECITGIGNKSDR